MRGTLSWLIVVFAWALATGAPVAGQVVEVAARGPRFLKALSPSSAPVPLDVRQVGVFRRRVSLDLTDASLEQALSEITRQSGLQFMYSQNVLAVGSSVQLQAKRITVAAALTELLVDAGVDVVLTRNGQAMLVRQNPVRSATGQGGGVTGRVTDAKTNVGLARAEVSLDGTRWRAATDTTGRYRLTEVTPGRYTITVRRLGYAKQGRQVTVREGQEDSVDLALEPVATRLNELVTTATGRRRRLEIANDITTLNADSIVRTQPVSSVTDILEGRVPGLTVQRTSGAPGDPARLRLRGAASPLRSNDPIVIVDGIRVYAEQSAARNANLAGMGDTTRNPYNNVNPGKNAYATPSPLDYIDPNSIETIEVIKGPEAATLYGQDAANGVIVITTKKGKAGPTRWSAMADYGRTHITGDYPELLLRWGHMPTRNGAVICPISNTVFGLKITACDGDSVVSFQLLNDPALTVLDRGRRTGLTLGASGGTQALTYAVTGSYQNELGLPKLPAYEAERYEARTGSAPPDWMRRPQKFTQWVATGNFRARLGAAADLSLMTQLSRNAQQRSSLEQQLGTLMGTYLDRVSGIYYRASDATFTPVTTDVLTQYYEQVTDVATAFTNVLNLDWRFRPWLTLAGDAGLNAIQRGDEIFLPVGAALGSDSVGHFSTGQGTTLTSTINARANALTPLGRGFVFRFATGVNYTSTSINDLSTQTRELTPGTRTRGAVITGLTPGVSDFATFGWYLAPSVGNSKFNIDAGLRLDGSSGGMVTFPKLPKMGFSYLISDEPFFPFKDLFQSFRVRVAYGKSTRQPNLTDRLRLFTTKPVYEDGTYVPGSILNKLGNTEVRPERSTGLEGGFDAQLWDSRLYVTVSGYRKTTEDAMMPVALPPSVYGDNVTVTRNYGVVRNTGLDLTLSTQWVRSGPLTWSTDLHVWRNHNVVVKLGPGVDPFNVSEDSRVVPGYPLYGRWTRPILGYADANGDGVLQIWEVGFQRAPEIQIGDTAVYVGETVPNYTATLGSRVSLWHGALTLSADLLHDHGVAQRNEVGRQLAPFSRGWNVPGTSIAEQAATAYLGQGLDYNWIQTVSTTRLNSLSVNYRLPLALARRLGAQQLSVAVQGHNLGVWTNYRGLDPNVNAFSTGNGVTDTGVLPQPRTWQLRVSADY